MITNDFHTHTCFSSDSDSSVESMIEQAISLGYTRICITDHMDYDFPKEYKLPFTFDVEEYFHKLTHLQQRYQEQIQVLIGIECGLKPDLANRYNTLLSHYPFDFVIGSSHLVNNQDPYQKEYWNTITEEEGIRAYFQSIIDNVKSGVDFDVYGHLDYVVRYGPTKNVNYSYEQYKPLIDELLQTIIDAGKGIEINTAGYKYGLNAPHPQLDIVARYFELGGKIITIGSDGHTPAHLGFGFEQVRESLLSLGITEYYVFERRVAIAVSL